MSPSRGSGSLLQSLHLYPKVPKDLTDATKLGGAISIACACLMGYLFISNIATYLKMTTTTDVALDDTGDVHMRLFFNITMVCMLRTRPQPSGLGLTEPRQPGLHAMAARHAHSVLNSFAADAPPPQERLPCQFASIDLFDVMGTSITNISADVTKFRVAADTDHKPEFHVDMVHRPSPTRLEGSAVPGTLWPANVSCLGAQLHLALA